MTYVPIMVVTCEASGFDVSTGFGRI